MSSLNGLQKRRKAARSASAAVIVIMQVVMDTRHFLRHVGNSLHLVVYKVTYTSVVLRSSKHFFATFCLYDAPRLILVCSSTLNETPSVDCNIISTFLRG